MYKLIQENLKWLIAAVAFIWIVSSMSSCVIETNISEDAAQVNIAKTYTEKGYIQKITKINGYAKYVWTLPGESVMIQSNDD